MRRDAGLTLIELVVAMALFSLVAVMGLQALTGTLRLSERLTEIDEGTGEIALAVALIRGDLEHLVPIAFSAPEGGPRAPVDLVRGVIGLSLAGQAALSPSHTDRRRAEWGLRPDGVLTRAAWPTLVPAEAAQRGPEAAVLADVTALRLRTFWPEVGWVEGAAPPLAGAPPPPERDGDNSGPAPAFLAADLPLAVEIVIESPRHGTLRVVERLR
ncbi:PulJ/GspJ family protein [Jannaschia seohaensis]|uniref:General secretion pathway protein J n=1 Tax=Jannaschia seohaensis TaxID=475081 RepID=A0A2Y9B582_9RHOB|nr:prepilin-type N-terminal cleavage/methylation domain-containing protein [Jannaschia seohaensis]PWJ15794.1 general secretion pathway protein J [Jannaschia seohaensis]SSA49479.1 general secretion pathway protein J [Jannaschia seohaensis]